MSSIAFCPWASACSCALPISAHASSTLATCSSTIFFQTPCASRTCEFFVSLIVGLSFSGEDRLDGREAKTRGRVGQGKMLQRNKSVLAAALQRSLQLVQLPA